MSNRTNTLSLDYIVNDVSEDNAFKVSLLIELIESTIVIDMGEEHLSKACFVSNQSHRLWYRKRWEQEAPIQDIISNRTNTINEL